MLQGCCKDIKEKFDGCFKEVSRKFPYCFKKDLLINFVFFMAVITAANQEEEGLVLSKFFFDKHLVIVNLFWSLVHHLASFILVAIN